MATCKYCQNDMVESAGCVEHVYLLNDRKEVELIRVGAPGDWSIAGCGRVCPECNAHIGKFHHIGCDLEVCRLCEGQYLTCSCDYSNELILHLEV